MERLSMDLDLEKPLKKYSKGIRLDSSEVYLVILALKRWKTKSLSTEKLKLLKRFQKLDERYKTVQPK
jgi:hypothetical protein